MTPTQQPVNADSQTVNQFILQIANTILSTLETFGIRFADLSVESMLADARRQTGLTDWGDEDFLDGLKQLVHSFETDAGLTQIGRISQRQDLMRLLTNRLRVQQALKEHPEIQQLPISRPLFILGYPRTGTTLLHRLLAQDPAVRVPLLWELLRSAPPASYQHGRHGQSDPRIRSAQWLVIAQRLFAPNLRFIHALAALQPDECVFLFHNTLYFTARGHIPGYVDWFSGQNMIADYRYYKQELQVLQWQRPGERWVLKSPFHLWSLDALLTVFPDACIVQLHRDPKQTIPSWCSLVDNVYQVTSRKPDRHRIGRDCLTLWSEGMARALNFRATANPAQFYDIHYEDLIADPVGEVERLYNYFDFPWNPAIEQNMRSWLAADQQKRQRKHQPHQYSLDTYGLTPELVEDRFRFYRMAQQDFERQAQSLYAH